MMECNYCHKPMQHLETDVIKVVFLGKFEKISESMIGDSTLVFDSLECFENYRLKGDDNEDMHL